LPFLQRRLIDGGLHRELVLGRLGAERHRRPEDRHLTLVTGHDGRLAAQGERADEAGSLDHGDLGVVAVVLGPAGDVLNGAVAVVGVDGDLLLVLPGEDALLG